MWKSRQASEQVLKIATWGGPCHAESTGYWQSITKGSVQTNQEGNLAAMDPQTEPCLEDTFRDETYTISSSIGLWAESRVYSD